MVITMKLVYLVKADLVIGIFLFIYRVDLVGSLIYLIWQLCWLVII